MYYLSFFKAELPSEGPQKSISFPRSPCTFISETIPLLGGMSAKSMSNTKGHGDHELVVIIEIKLADVTGD